MRLHLLERVIDFIKRKLSTPIKRKGKDKEISKIQFIGVGCGGINIVNYLHKTFSHKYSFSICDMDNKVLIKSCIPNKLQIGSSGLGSGNNIFKAREEAEKESQKIRELVDSEKEWIILISCYGGGSGTGITPIIARIAKQMNKKVMAFITVPFNFEGELKKIIAECEIKYLNKETDTIFYFENESIIMEFGETGLFESFQKVNEIIKDEIRYLLDYLSSNNMNLSNYNCKNAKLINKIYE